MRHRLARTLRSVAQRLDPEPTVEDYEDWEWKGVYGHAALQPLGVEHDDGR